MAWINNFLEKLFPTKNKIGSDVSAIIIDIPPELYYKELAIYTASSLISNAISRSEIKVFREGQIAKNEDYYLLNVSPNANETSSAFWHKVINRAIRQGEALIVEAGGKLYCADSYSVKDERPILGDTYTDVTVGNFTFSKLFTQADTYKIKLDNINVSSLIDGMYEEYGKIIKTATTQYKLSNGQKYKIHLAGVQAGDEKFNETFNNYISEQLKEYIKGENVVFPEYDGMVLSKDEGASGESSDDITKLKEDLFNTVAHAFHIPDSMMTGNINNLSDVVGAFLSFGVDPYADMITEALNKRGGVENFAKGNYYQVDTGKINHRDIFNVAPDVSNLISSGVMCIDEVREELGYAPIGEEWSRQHYITLNFSEIEEHLQATSGNGGEKN